MLRQPILILSLLSGMLPACNRSSEFSGKSATQTPEPPPPPLDAEPEPDPPPPPEPETVITTIGSIKGVLVPEPRTGRIWVATTTGRPASRHTRTIRRWTVGTSSGGGSMSTRRLKAAGRSSLSTSV